MAIVRSTQALELIRDAYEKHDEELVLTSFKLRRAQKGMIEKLASWNAESQAAVIRAIIDEWSEMKAREL